MLCVAEVLCVRCSVEGCNTNGTNSINIFWFESSKLKTGGNVSVHFERMRDKECEKKKMKHRFAVRREHAI